MQPFEPQDRASILVVDDRPEKHVVFRALLEDLGQNVIGVASGEQALRQVLDLDFAVILLDVNMPGLDGLETASLIRRRKRSAHVPIIFITADYGDESRTAKAYALGAVDFLVSPVAPEIVRSKVKVFVDLWLMSQQARRRAEERLMLAEERAARAAAERANERLAFLANASALLGRSLSLGPAISELAALAVPFLADVSAVTLRAAAGREARTELSWAVAGTGEVRRDSVRVIEDSRWRDAITSVLATCAVATVAVEDAHSLASGAGVRLPDGTRVTSLLVLPLTAGGNTLGAMSLGLTSTNRHFDANSLAMANDLANRAAMAFDNALLYEAVHAHDRRKNEFLAMLSHELRNPLAPITNALVILEQGGADATKRTWATQVIGRQVRQLTRLVNDLLDVSRITQGKIDLKLELVSITEVVATAVETVRPLIDAKEHVLTISLPPETVRVRCDHARLAQVLANLLNNAAKYTDTGGRIELAVAREGREVAFRIRDSGVGIPADTLGSIFDLFTQADRTLDRSQGGLGVGLTLVKRLVEMQGGRVSASSSGENQGSEFAVWIPASDIHCLGKGEGHLARDRVPSTPRSRVLVVDDNEDSVESMAMLLRLSGHDVQVARDGVSALASLRATKADAALLDIGLPEMDGYQLARRIRAMPEHAKMLLLATSGYAHESHRREATAAGFDDYLVKPVDMDRLDELLTHAIRRQPNDNPEARP